MKKKLLSMGMAIAFLLSFNSQAAAIWGEIIDTAEITPSEAQVVQLTMEFYDLAEATSFEVLYDYQDQPNYLLGYSSDSYLIMDREAQIALEWGEGNPYSSYPNAKKYYGAILNYYVETQDAQNYKNIRTGEIETAIIHTQYSTEELMSFGDGSVTAIPYGKNANLTTSRASSRYTANTPVVVTNADSLIRNKAFGKNSSIYCSAVATTIALNYLDIVKNDDIVPSNMELETLTSDDYDENLYPRATRFYEYIRVGCGMGGMTPPGVVKTAIDDYASRYDIDLTVSWSAPDRFDLMESIDNNVPGLITVWGTEGTESGINFSYHTVVAYGYKTYVDWHVVGWLIHLGWWGDDYIELEEDGHYYQKEQWINPAIGSSTLFVFSGSAIE